MGNKKLNHKITANLKGALSVVTKDIPFMLGVYSNELGNQGFDYSQWLEFQNIKKEKIIAFSINNVPFYNSRYSSNTSLCGMDFLTKDQIREHRESLSCKITKLKIKALTSGTTNQPLTLWRSPSSIIAEQTFVRRHWAQSGYSFRDKVAVIRGEMPCTVNGNEPPFWCQNFFENKLLMSSYHIGIGTGHFYFKALEKFQPKFIQAYPSSIINLAKIAELNCWSPNWEIKGVFTSSETFKKEDQELVARVFGPVFDHYGHAERAALMQTCSKGNYHLIMDYGFLEFDPVDDGNFEIIATGFTNKLMPLIRYRTGDFVDHLPLHGCGCGLNTPYLQGIQGRQDDCVQTPDGRSIGRLDVAFKGISGLLEAQIVQNELSSIIVKYVAASNDVSHRVLETAIFNNLRERVGQEIEVILERVDFVPKGANGKFRSVISKVEN